MDLPFPAKISLYQSTIKHSHQCAYAESLPPYERTSADSGLRMRRRSTPAQAALRPHAPPRRLSLTRQHAPLCSATKPDFRATRPLDSTVFARSHTVIRLPWGLHMRRIKIGSPNRFFLLVGIALGSQLGLGGSPAMAQIYDFTFDSTFGAPSSTSSIEFILSGTQVTGTVAGSGTGILNGGSLSTSAANNLTGATARRH